MLSNYYTLQYLASSLAKHVEGKTLTAAFSQEKDQLILAFAGGRENVLISCMPDENACYLHAGFERARRNSVDLFTSCIGLVLGSVSMEPADRVIILSFSGGFRMLIQFFGPKSNVLLLDSNNIIIEAFKTGRTRTGNRYEVAQRETLLDFPFLQKAIETGASSTIFSVVRSSFPSLGTTLTKECLYRSKLQPSSSAGSISREGVAAIQLAIVSLIDDIKTPEARVYLGADEFPERFSIIPLHHLELLVERRFPDLHEGIRFFISRRRAAAGVEHSKASLLSSIRQQIQKAQRTVSAIGSEISGGYRSDDYERFGSLVMTNHHSIGTGTGEISLSGDGDVVRIPLDRRLSAVQNAQRYFEKAKRARTAEKEASLRLTSLQSRIAKAEQLLSSIEGAHTKEEVKEYMAAHEHELKEFGIGKKGVAGEHLPFRVFTVDGGFEVWVGKNSANNDLLTMKHAKPNDLWFHARGSGGSHVVLRVASAPGEPGKKAKEQAAGIAAYYSKMKNASMVPVAMTEKKFVRKPKGSPPGTVVLDREKVIFAEPALPH